MTAIQENTTPAKTQTLLGYADWQANQLEQGLANNVWLSSLASAHIVFAEPYQARIMTTASNMGIDLNQINPHLSHD